MRQGEVIRISLKPGEVDDVEIECAIAPAFDPHATVVGLDAVQLLEQGLGVQCALHEHHRVEVGGRVRIRSRRFDGVRLNDSRDCGHHDIVERRDVVHGGPQVVFPVSEI